MLMFSKRPNPQGIKFLKMAACGSDFLVAYDFDAVMARIDTDMLENDTEMLPEVNSVVKYIFICLFE